VTRIAITGGPRTGKTTFADRLGEERGLTVTHTDSFMDLGWSEASQAVCDHMRGQASGIVEGVAVPRALRKALAADPKTKPVDKLIVMGTPRETRTPGQIIMAKGVKTVLDEILPDLRRLGVEIEWHRDGDR
jgi:adenylate kinase family enzyme